MFQRNTVVAVKLVDISVYLCCLHVVFQRKNRGVIMVNFHRNFITFRGKANISHVAGKASMR